jgi:RNA polymerase sigma-70 factor (ECF subfamily)
MSESERGLVERAQAGDRLAFEELVRRTSRLVYARLYLATGDRQWAEDLVQETWILAYRALPKLHDASALRPWILAIAQNVLAEAVRRQARHKRSPPQRVGSQALLDLPGKSPSPADHAEQSDMNNQVLAIMRSLPEEYRLPLTLRYIMGADYETIETQLGLSNGALRGTLQRGLKMLRARLCTRDEGRGTRDESEEG